jgi:hypothetical protein
LGDFGRVKITELCLEVFACFIGEFFIVLPLNAAILPSYQTKLILTNTIFKWSFEVILSAGVDLDRS